jgi:hypothetical protein
MLFELQQRVRADSNSILTSPRMTCSRQIQALMVMLSR